MRLGLPGFFFDRFFSCWFVHSPRSLNAPCPFSTSCVPSSSARLTNTEPKTDCVVNIKYIMTDLTTNYLHTKYSETAAFGNRQIMTGAHS